MTARDIESGRIYEGGKTFIGSIIGRHRNTLSKWENKGIEYKICNGYEIRFLNVIRNSTNRGKHNSK